MKKNSKYIHIDSKIKYFCFLCFYFLLLPIARIIYHRKNLWLICERGVDAQDNGFWFFKYLNDFHPEIKSYFIISKTSSDFLKVKKTGRVILAGSLRHILTSFGSKVKISSHLYGYSPFKYYNLYLRRNKTNDIHVFLQHGITKNDLPGFYANVTNLSLFVCGALPEFNFINKNFGYEKNIVQYTGFARFDYLENRNLDNTILIMPTWRRNIIDLEESEFKKTNFYKSWVHFLSSKELLALQRKYNLKINFYLHFLLQKYSKLFKNLDNINVINFEKMSVNDLLCCSSLLITDFSSVYFDFAFLRKPVLYYQFDEKDYYLNHYSKGYFDYRKDGFGPVCINTSELINSLSFLCKNKFVIENKYLSRRNAFFTLSHYNNCKRIYDTIIKKIENEHN